VKKVKTLKQRWILFLDIVLDPWVLFLLVSVIGLVILSAAIPYTIEAELTKSVLTIIISVVSSLLGGIFAQKWNESTEEQVLVARGKSAIRSLKLMILNIEQIEKRVRVYLKRLSKVELNQELFKSQFEEIIEKCKILQEEGLNSIENWTDIIPEANIKTQIGIVSGLKEKANDLEGQLINYKNKIEEDKKISDQEKKLLTAKISQKEKELENTKSELYNEKFRLNESFPSISLLNSTISSDTLVSLHLNTCTSCGKQFQTYLSHQDKCDQCQSKVSNDLIMPNELL